MAEDAIAVIETAIGDEHNCPYVLRGHADEDACVVVVRSHVPEREFRRREDVPRGGGLGRDGAQTDEGLGAYDRRLAHSGRRGQAERHGRQH